MKRLATCFRVVGPYRVSHLLCRVTDYIPPSHQTSPSISNPSDCYSYQSTSFNLSISKFCTLPPLIVWSTCLRPKRSRAGSPNEFLAQVLATTDATSHSSFADQASSEVMFKALHTSLLFEQCAYEMYHTLTSLLLISFSPYLQSRLGAQSVA